MASGKGRKNLRYKVINGKSTCYFKTVMYDDSFEISAVTANVKLQLPII
jgi:hypothetical protein